MSYWTTKKERHCVCILGWAPLCHSRCSSHIVYITLLNNPSYVTVSQTRNADRMVNARCLQCCLASNIQYKWSEVRKLVIWHSCLAGLIQPDMNAKILEWHLQSTLMDTSPSKCQLYCSFLNFFLSRSLHRFTSFFFSISPIIHRGPMYLNEMVSPYFSTAVLFSLWTKKLCLRFLEH